MKDEEWSCVRRFAENCGLSAEATYKAIGRGLVGNNPLPPWEKRLNAVLVEKAEGVLQGQMSFGDLPKECQKGECDCG